MYNIREARDCLRGASPRRERTKILTQEWYNHFGNGVSIVVSEWESHSQGEGKQVARYLKEGGTRDA